jgi:phage terminase small subunit
MTKRNPSNTAQNTIKTFQNVLQGDIQPPDHLISEMRERDWDYWYAITRARAKDSWNTIDLTRAVSLAKTQADITMLQAELDNEGYTIENARGTVVDNPKARILETLTRREISMARSLHVHAEATVGRSEKAAPALSKQNDAAMTIASMDDDLIAMPSRIN